MIDGTEKPIRSLQTRRHRLLSQRDTTNLAINQATKKNTCQNFPTQKIPEIENFKPPKQPEVNNCFSILTRSDLNRIRKETIKKRLV